MLVGGFWFPFGNHSFALGKACGTGLTHHITSLYNFLPRRAAAQCNGSWTRDTKQDIPRRMFPVHRSIRRRRNLLYENLDPVDVTAQDIDSTQSATPSIEPRSRYPEQQYDTQPTASVIDVKSVADKSTQIDERQFERTTSDNVVGSTPSIENNRNRTTGTGRRANKRDDSGWDDWETDSLGWDSWDDARNKTSRLENATSSSTGQPDGLEDPQPYDRLTDETFNAFSDVDGDGRAVDPDIEILTDEEKESILPVIPFQDQARFFGFGGDVVVLLQRVGTALALTVMLSKYALLAGGSLTYPLWLPWVRALAKNTSVKQRFPFVGLWRARILEVNIAVPRMTKRSGTLPFMTTTLLVGDDSGARAEITVDYNPSHEQLFEGQPAEMLVLSRESKFIRFKALKEAYLPESAMWIASYPYVDREKFLELSLAIERERQAALNPTP